MIKLNKSLEKKLKKIKYIFFDFDGVFTDNSVYIGEDGKEFVKCSRSDGIGLKKLIKEGLEPYIVSSEKNKVVSARAKKIGIKSYQNVENKGSFLEKFFEENNISKDETLFLGNDINDISAYKKVGIKVAVLDAFPELDSFIDFKTSKKGGEGAVREICDLVVYHNNIDE